MNNAEKTAENPDNGKYHCSDFEKNMEMWKNHVAAVKRERLSDAYGIITSTLLANTIIQELLARIERYEATHRNVNEGLAVLGDVLAHVSRDMELRP